MLMNILILRLNFLYVLYTESILFDQSGNMATACFYSSQVNLYNNSFYTGKSIQTAPYETSLAFDSKGRFIVVSWYQISIYY